MNELRGTVVGPERALYAAEALGDELMLTSVRHLEPGRSVLAKIRYKSEKMPARAYMEPAAEGERAPYAKGQELAAETAAKSALGT